MNIQIEEKQMFVPVNLQQRRSWSAMVTDSDVTAGWQNNPHKGFRSRICMNEMKQWTKMLCVVRVSWLAQTP